MHSKVGYDIATKAPVAIATGTQATNNGKKRLAGKMHFSWDAFWTNFQNLKDLIACVCDNW